MKRIIFFLCCLYATFCVAQNTLGTLNALHQVMKGETLWGIAHQYNVTPEALEQANPEIKKGKVKRGMLLVIPRQVVSQSIDVSPVMEVPVVSKAYTSLKVGVLLPFEEGTERAAKFVEFYQGLLMAVDSVKHEGINVELYALHCGQTAATMQTALSNEALRSLTIIFGPADAEQIPVLSDFCQTNAIRLVLPFSNAFDLTGRPHVFAATAASNVLQQDAARMIVEQYAERNYVFLQTNNPDERGRQFSAAMRAELSKRGIAARNLNIEGDDFALEGALNQFKQNCIIPDNASIRTLNVLISRLNSFCPAHPDYRISLQGYPEWQTYTASLLLDFYRYDTYFYSSYYRNPLVAATENFEQRFSLNFHHPMQVSFPRYGTMGFDMGYYFLHGLSQLGERFEQEQSTLSLSPIQHPFRFVQDVAGNGFTNHAVQLIHYTPSQTIEQIQ